MGTTKTHSNFLNHGQKRQLIREYNSFSKNAGKKSETLVAFAKKWTEITEQSPRHEKKFYKRFIAELMEIVGLKEFEGRSGEYDFERAFRRRPHDCVIGNINVEDSDCIYTTAIEIKPPSWDLDLDRNEKNETVLEQAINVSEGNPFLRQLITTNFKSLRVYLPFFGFENFEQFSLDRLVNEEDDRFLLLALLDPKITVEHNINSYRSLIHKLIESTLTEKKKKIDSLYELYVDALNSTTKDIRDQSLITDPVEARQLATQFINRFMFVEYSFQTGLHDAPLKDLLAKFESKKLFQLFNVMDKGGDFEGKKIPQFNGGLFHTNKTLNSLVPSRKAFAAIRSLTDIQLSDMAPEVLGRIFEMSLSASLSELPNSPTESDSLGAVYTPSFLASAMARLCFTMVGDSPKILDPSCGSGVFVLESLKLMLGKVENRNGRSIEKFLSKNITAWDINPAAVELTRFMVWQHVANLDLPLPSIENNIHVGDALLGNLEEKNSRPNIVIGNPPFIAHQNLRRSYKDSLEKKFKVTIDPREQYDICVAFFEKALDVIEDDGVVSFISPNQLAFRPYGEKLRNYILEKNEVERIVDLTQVKVFDKAICPFVYVLRKGQTKNKPKSFNIYTDINTFSGVVDAFEATPVQSEFVSLRHDKSLEFLARGLVNTGIQKIDNWKPDVEIAANTRRIKDILVASPHRGKVNKAAKGQKKVKVITSKFHGNQPKIENLKLSDDEASRIQERFGSEKIVFPRFFQSQMVSAIYNKSFAVGDNVYYLSQKDLKADILESLDYLNCLINSRFYSLIDYARSGLDRINHFGFRAMDGQKFSDLILPTVTKLQMNKLLTKYQLAAPYINLTNTSSKFRIKNRVHQTRLKKVVEFEREVALLFGLSINHSEMLSVLNWWATKRENFLENSGIEDAA